MIKIIDNKLFECNIKCTSGIKIENKCWFRKCLGCMMNSLSESKSSKVMGAGLDLELCWGGVLVPDGAVQGGNITVQCFAKKGTCANCPVAPVTRSILIMAFMQDTSPHHI